MRRTNKVSDNQQGLVAIIVTLILMLVLTLIVTGFAQLARREQREALDRQLASQALYAAESGINAAEVKINEDLAAGNTDNYTECSGPGSFDASGVGTQNEKPTCVLIKKDQTELKYQNVETNKSTIVPINPGPTTTLTDLTISWENKDGGNAIKDLIGPITGNIFTSATSWGTNNVGILRVDIVPVTNLSPDALRDSMFTAFLVPTKSSGTAVDFSTGSGVAKQGIKVAANCTTAPKKQCAAHITGLDAYGEKFYLRMKSIYNVADVIICPSDGFGCDPNKTLAGAQAEIDVTAKAADVLKRVQVRIPTDPNASGSATIPEYTLDSAESVCKLLEVTPGSTITNGC